MRNGSRRAALSRPSASAGSRPCRSATARTRAWSTGWRSKSSTPPARPPTRMRRSPRCRSTRPTPPTELAARGRARWKIENESSNVLKTKGYDLEHNFGHGKENLSALSVTMNLLAFAWHALLDLTAKAWQTARQRTGSAQALLPGPRRHHRLPSVPQPGRPHANPHRRRATPRRPCPPESHQHQTKTQRPEMPSLKAS